MDEQSVRERFVVDDAVVSCLPGADRNVTAQRRYSEWKQSIGGEERLGTEYLVPRITRQIEAHWPPPFTSRRRRLRETSNEDLRARVEKLGPWMTPFPIAEGINTMSEGTANSAGAHRMAFR